MIPNSEHWRVSVAEAQKLQHDIMGYLPGFATPRIVCDVPFVGKRWVHQVAEYDRERGISLLDEELPHRHRARGPRGAHPSLRVLRPHLRASRVRAGVVARAGGDLLRDFRDMASVSAPSEPWRVLYPDATADQWNDWRWQMRHSVRSLAELEKHLTLTDAERAGCRGDGLLFRLGISPYYLSLMDRGHPFCPVRMQAIPVASEARIRPGELQDPLGEDKTRPVPAIVHRYPDRVLLLALDSCSTYCRHCTRRRITKGGEAELSRAELARGIHYIREHREVRDVLISGGDPFLLSEARLEELLSPLRAIPHVEMVRIGTRVPVCLPMRVTEALCRLLRSYAPLFVVTHFNHPKEVTPEARAACERLVDHGVPVENQAVLLRRVNSEAHLIKELSHALLRVARASLLPPPDGRGGGVRAPADAAGQGRGDSRGPAGPHLGLGRSPPRRGLAGRGRQSDASAGVRGGTRGTETVFRNFRNETYRYPEPEETDCSCPYDEVWRRPPG